MEAVKRRSSRVSSIKEFTGKHVISLFRKFWISFLGSAWLFVKMDQAEDNVAKRGKLGGIVVGVPKFFLVANETQLVRRNFEFLDLFHRVRPPIAGP